MTHLLLSLYQRSTPLLIVLALLIFITFCLARQPLHEARYRATYHPNIH
jgi:hypothetical protein